MNGHASSTPRQRAKLDAPWLLDRVPALVGLLLGSASVSVGVVQVVPLLPVRPWHAFVGVALVVAMSTARRRGVSRPRLLAADYVLLAVVGVCTVAEQVNSRILSVPADIGGAVYPAYFLLGYAATRFAVRDHRDASRFLTPFVVPVVLAAAVSIGQLRSQKFAELVLTFAPSAGLTQRLESGRELRATALVGHWTGAGMYFCAMVAACACALLIGRPVGRRGAVVSVALVASLVGAYTSATLSVIATAAFVLVATLVVGSRQVRRLIIAAGAVSAVLAFVVARSALTARVDEQIDPTRTRPSDSPDVPSAPDGSWVPSTLSYRWRIWTEETLPAIADRPLTGWGASVFDSPATPAFVQWKSAESQWLATALSFGVPAAMLLIGMLAAVGFLLVSRRSGISPPVVALFGMSVLSAFTVPVFTNRGLPVPFWVLLALIAAVSGRVTPSGRDDTCGHGLARSPKHE